MTEQGAFGILPRDRWGRPFIVPPEGGKAVPYTRCTTYVGALEDTYNLEKWKMRQVAIGLAERPDLVLAAAAHREDKDRLNKTCDAAVEAAKSSAAANVGTALHALVDQYDQGTLDLARVPAAYRPDIEAYAKATAKLKVIGIECFGVVDSHRIGGTWDRVYQLPDGRYVIGDTKTGSVEYGMGKIAMQLAVYSRATPYAPEGIRGMPNPAAGIDQATALVVHLPAGTGTCELLSVDIAAGWEAVGLAGHVRAWRARKDLSRPYDPNTLIEDGLSTLIGRAASADELRGLWAAWANEWTPDHTELAKARLALIDVGVAG